MAADMVRGRQMVQATHAMVRKLLLSIGVMADLAVPVLPTFMRDPPFQLQERVEGRQRQQFEMRLLFGEGVVDDPLGGGVKAQIGNRIEPMR